MGKITTERSFALVGEFMSKWAIAEYSADEVIASALDLTPIQIHLLATTIPVANKLALTKTMIVLSDMKEKEKAHYTKQVNRFLGQTEHRNTIAHCMFYVSEDANTINFIRFAVRGKLAIDKDSNIQTTRWTVAQFENHFRMLDNLSDELTELQEKVIDPLNPELNRFFRQMKRGTDGNPFETASMIAALMKKFPVISDDGSQT